VTDNQTADPHGSDYAELDDLVAYIKRQSWYTGPHPSHIVEWAILDEAERIQATSSMTRFWRGVWWGLSGCWGWWSPQARRDAWRYINGK
jgi:hypothetical protein